MREDRDRRRRQRRRRTTRCCSPPAARAWMPPIEGLDKEGVFAFRTLDDTRALLRRAPGLARKAVVIGGGLLGLEAARGLQVQGCDVTVVHLMDTLMERQLDPHGRPLPDGEDGGPGHPRAARTRAPQRSSATAASTASRSRTAASIDADLVVVAAGIRPNVELGRKAGLHGQPRHRRQRPSWRRRTPTSSRSANASSTAASATAWSRRSSSRARCWRPRSPATRGPTYQGTVQAAKLKIMGVDVFSAGDWSDDDGRRAGALRGSRARRLQEAGGPRRQARRRDPGRRHLRQPPLHGVAAHRTPI